MMRGEHDHLVAAEDTLIALTHWVKTARFLSIAAARHEAIKDQPAVVVSALMRFLEA